MASIATGAAVRTVRNNGYSGTENNGGNGILVVIVEAGLSGTSPTVTATWNGVSMTKTIERGIGTNAGVIIFTLASPATGSNTLTIAGFSSIRQRVWFVPTNDTASVRSSNGATTAGGTSLTTAITTASGDLVLAGLALRVATDPTVVASGDAGEVSEGQIISTDVQSWGWESSFVANDTTADMGASWTGSLVGALAGVSLENAALSPTITVQPTAQTARVNGDTTNTATFTCTATGTGTVDLTAEIESGVGSGSFGTLANGSGATWTGLTGTGSGSASVTLVGTFTAKTLSGRKVRLKADDDNGTSYSSEVVLTVLDGPVLSAASATTNGSGVATVTMTSDDALTANGEILLVTATVRGQVVARTTVRPA